MIDPPIFSPSCCRSVRFSRFTRVIKISPDYDPIARIPQTCKALLRRRSRQPARAPLRIGSVHLLVCLYVAKMRTRKRDFLKKLSKLEL